MKNYVLLLKTGLFALLLFSFTSCEKDEIGMESLDAKTVINAPGGGGKKPPTAEVIGNNLSFPVIWSDGITKTLRGTYGEESFTGQYFTLESSDYYIQGDPGNTWQAASFDPTQALGEETDPIGPGTVAISSVDWGDNLEAKAWPFGSQIRVEVVLYKDLDNGMKAYEMKIQDETQSGLTEVWGAKTDKSQGSVAGVTYLADSATVYSGMAKLVIQKLVDVPEGQTSDVTWNPDLSRWEGEHVGAPLFEGGVWEAGDGPAGYSAEINVQGKIIYGYNWVTRTTGDGPGSYRLTFVLDKNFTGTQNTSINGSTVIAVTPTEEVVTIAEEPTGGTPYIFPEGNLSYIDVQLLPKTGSGGGNSGQGGGNSGEHPGKGNGPGGK